MSSIVGSKFIYLILVLIGLWASRVRSATLHGLSMSERHKQWMARYGRTYANETEKERRFAIFKANVEYIESFNRDGSESYRLGINGFADLTNREFRASRNGYRPVYSGSRSIESVLIGRKNVTSVPASVDWREEGVVTPVKDQGQCGCCWAFSAVAAMEGINKLAAGNLISLSEQELVDCDKGGSDQGCQGGLMDGAYKFIVDNNGLSTEADYPYRGNDGTCDQSRAISRAAKITGYKDVLANNECALLLAVANQPVSVAIDASGYSFQFYSSGVFTGLCGTNLNHGVTAVGYGTDGVGTKYWLVKNSWGTDWGEDGYIRMQRDVPAEEGLCGIAMQASYPTA